MVCIIAPSPAQSLSRSSSLKGARAGRNLLGSTPTRFGRVSNPPQAIVTNLQKSVSPESPPAEPHEERLVEAVKELYSCMPTPSSLSVYAPDVVFQSGTGAFTTRGREQLHEHFQKLQKRYPFASVLHFHVSRSADSILIDLEVEYFRDMNASVPAETCKGTVQLELDASKCYIVRHIEKWESKADTSPVDGISLASLVPRRMSATQRNAEPY